MPNRQANQAGFYGSGQIWSVGGLVGQTFQFLAEVQHRSNGGGPCGTPTATPTATPTFTPTATPRQLPHSRRQRRDGNCHAYADSDAHGDCHVHADGDRDSHVYADGDCHSDVDCNCHSDRDTNIDRSAAAFTDAATSADTAASSLAIVRTLGNSRDKTREFPHSRGSARQQRSDDKLISESGNI